MTFSEIQARFKKDFIDSACYICRAYFCQEALGVSDVSLLD